MMIVWVVMLHKKSIAATTEIIKCNLKQCKESRRVIVSYPPKSHDAPIPLSLSLSLSLCFYLFIFGVIQYDNLLLLLLLLVMKGSMGDVGKEEEEEEEEEEMNRNPMCDVRCWMGACY